MIKTDLHIHTNYSPDATNQPKAIVEKLNKHPTTKAIAITDHNTCKAYPILQELAKPYPDILIIPGIEVSAEEGELIILGITEPPPKPWKAQTLVDYAQDNNAVTIAPHPYRGYGLADQIQTLNLNAIETLNGITPPYLNKKAEQTAKTRKLPQVAGSDAHDSKDPWNVYTKIQASLNIDDILNAIKHGNTKPCTIKSIHF